MPFDSFLLDFQIYLLIFARIMSVLMTAPLISSDGIPSIAKVGLGLMTAVLIMNFKDSLGYVIPENALAYVLLIIGEIMIGLITGFLLQLVYAGFQTAGQFFSVQMGFGASEVFDPLSNDELPLMGQLFNLIAMYVFLSVQGLQRLFLRGIYGSFLAIKAQDFVLGQNFLSQYFLGALTNLFSQALLLSFPIMGTLFLLSLTMGLLAKAAPQMNLLSMGFPVNFLVAFVLLIFILPQMMEFFSGLVDQSYNLLDSLFRDMAGGASKTTSFFSSPWLMQGRFI